MVTVIGIQVQFSRAINTKSLGTGERCNGIVATDHLADKSGL